MVDTISCAFMVPLSGPLGPIVGALAPWPGFSAGGWPFHPDGFPRFAFFYYQSSASLAGSWPDDRVLLFCDYEYIVH